MAVAQDDMHRATETETGRDGIAVVRPVRAADQADSKLLADLSGPRVAYPGATYMKNN
jgi:hypothetical protein